MKDLPANAEDEAHRAPVKDNAQQAPSDNKSRGKLTEPSPSAMKSEVSCSSEVMAGERKKFSNSRKSVSFTEDTKKESLLEHKSKTKIPTVRRVDPVIALDGVQDEEAPQQQPVIPSNESTEDAALRQQMIQYNMSEVNNIVAEMNLEDDASDASYSDAGSEEVRDDSSLDEDEDNFGRTKRRVLSDEYLAEMRALEQRLNAKALQNVGPNTPLEFSASASGHQKEGEPPMQPTTNGAKNSPKPTTTKSVRFAEELDIQSSPPPHTKSPPPTSTKSSKPIHANKIIERPYSTTLSTAPPEPDDLDPALLNQQVKTEYNKMRNRMIQRQGGFTGPEDGAEVPLTEEEGGPKKMSRFKAARLGRERLG